MFCWKVAGAAPAASATPQCRWRSSNLSRCVLYGALSRPELRCVLQAMCTPQGEPARAAGKRKREYCLPCRHCANGAKHARHCHHSWNARRLRGRCVGRMRIPAQRAGCIPVTCSLGLQLDDVRNCTHASRRAVRALHHVRRCCSGCAVFLDERQAQSQRIDHAPARFIARAVSEYCGVVRCDCCKIARRPCCNRSRSFLEQCDKQSSHRRWQLHRTVLHTAKHRFLFAGA